MVAGLPSCSTNKLLRNPAWCYRPPGFFFNKEGKPSASWGTGAQVETKELAKMFKQLITTNFEDEESNRRGRLLNILVLSWGAFIALGLIVAIIRSSEAGVIAAQGGLLLIIALSYLLVRQGQLNPAIYLFLIGNAIFMTASLLPPGVPPILFLVIPYLLSFVVIASGMLLAPHSPFIFATFTTVLLLIAMALRGGPSAVDIPETKANEALYLAIALPANYVLAALSWLNGNNLNQALQKERQSASDLSVQLRRNEELVSKLQDQLERNKLLIGQLQEAAEKLAPMAEELSSSSEELHATAEQIASSVQQVAQGAQVQAERAGAVSKSVERMAAATEQIAADAQTGAEGSAQLQERLDEAAKVLGELGAKTEEIDRIVELVDRFADQTNLLALNAAIEAARAGEHGRGFAVVAEEVRKLAESSRQSVKEIARISGEIRQELKRVALSMEEVIKATERTAEMARQISMATARQEDRSDEMVRAVNEIASAAEESAAAAEEVSSAVEEQTTSTEELATAAQELAEMAARLKDAVAKFGVD